MLAGADAVIESFPPGWLEARDLAPATLVERHPHLVVTSITPFGRTGPTQTWSTSDLLVAATSGLLWLCGDNDRAPTRVGAPQYDLHASMEGAVATLVALAAAQQSGKGQHVDVSGQLAGMRTLMNAQAFHLLEGRELSRNGPYSSYSHARFRMIIACRDGYVTLLPAAGLIGAPMMRYLTEWAVRDGVCDPRLVGVDWAEMNFAAVAADLENGQAFFDAVSTTFERLFANYTKAELYAAALEHLILLAPVTTVADLRVDTQLAARGYFQPVGSTNQAGVWAKLSRTPLTVGTPAPRVGQHDATLWAESARRPASAGVAGPVASMPFGELKVFDMSWVGVGPMTAGYLGAYGATVVKLESSKRPDVLRLTAPFRDGKPGINNSHFFGDFNANKLGLGVDLTNPRGREVAWRMIEWADVVLESFTPRALRGWGMDWEAISARRPDVVMLSTCMQGQTGPRSNYRGFGNLMGSLAGFYELTGWPDRGPGLIYGAYTDFVSQRFTTCALLAALDHRRRTGEGQHIDVAQYEAALQFLGPELLAYEADGRVASRCGNRDRDRSPHGVFRCTPEPGRPEGWVAIACEDDAQWTALAAVAGLPNPPEWATLAGRKADEDHLDAAVEAWTATLTPSAVVALLQPGVAAAPVLSIPELHTDPQIAHRDYWVPLEHPVYGLTPYSGLAHTMSATPGSVRTPSPCLGEHSWQLLEEIAGLDPDEIASLLADDVVEITS